MKADTTAKRAFFKTKLGEEDAKRKAAITEKATWVAETTRLTGLWTAAVGTAGESAAKSTLDTHTGVADAAGAFAKGKLIDDKVTNSKTAYRALMEQSESEEELLRKIELE